MTLEEFKALVEKATPAEWVHQAGTVAVRVLDTAGIVATAGRIEDRAFIAASRSFVPRLIAVAEAARHYFFEPCNDGALAQEQYQRMRAMILALEHGGADKALAALEAPNE